MARRPASASYAVVGVGLAVGLLGERPGLLALIGAIVTIAGVMLTSTDLPKLRAAMMEAAGVVVGGGGRHLLRDLQRSCSGLSGAVGGWVPGLFASRVAQVLVSRRCCWCAGASSWAWLCCVVFALLTGLADLLGVVTYSIGSERGYLSIVLAASAVFPTIRGGGISGVP